MLVNIGSAGQLALLSDMAFCAPHRVVICVASLQKRLGLTTKDADFSAEWFTRDQLGMTFLDQVGLMNMSDLLELSKGLSKIGAKGYAGKWSGSSKVGFVSSRLLESFHMANDMSK